jgi:hypothetical protein
MTIYLYILTVFFRSSDLVDEEFDLLKDKKHTYTEQELMDAIPLFKSYIFILAKEGYHKDMFEPNFVANVLHFYQNAEAVCGSGSKPSRYAGLLLSSLAVNDFEPFAIDLVKCGAPKVLLEKCIELQSLMQKSIAEQLGSIANNPTTAKDMDPKIANLLKVNQDIEHILKTLFALSERRMWNMT